MTRKVLVRRWGRLWMRFAGLSLPGRIATRLATWFAPPHKARVYLSRMYSHGYIAPSAVIYHLDLQLGNKNFLDEGVHIFQSENGGSIRLGDDVVIYRDTSIETGEGGTVSIGKGTSIHPRCQINGYVANIQIGSDVMIAPNCAFYSYDHGLKPGSPIISQPLQSRGDIVVGEGAWLGFGVIVLGGVRIGAGAVIGAGSVVTKDIPDNAIAVGSPAKVVKMRHELA